MYNQSNTIGKNPVKYISIHTKYPRVHKQKMQPVKKEKKGEGVKYHGRYRTTAIKTTTMMILSAMGSFTCLTQHMGPMALPPIQRTEQWLSVLLKDTGVTIGTRTHTLLIRNTRVYIQCL